jgi:hypothetical protein
MLHRAFVPGLTAFARVVLAVCCVTPTTSSASVIRSDSALYGVPRAEGPARMEFMAQARPPGASQVIPPGGSQLPFGATQTPPGTIQTLPGAPPTTRGIPAPQMLPPAMPSAPVTQPPLSNGTPNQGQIRGLSLPPGGNGGS